MVRMNRILPGDESYPVDRCREVLGEKTDFVELIEPLESSSIDSTLRTTLSYPVVRPFNVLAGRLLCDCDLCVQ